MLMRRIGVMVVALLITIPSAAREVVRGQLCVSGAPCGVSACGALVDPASEPRLYTFARSGGNWYEFGVLDASASRIQCETKASVDVQLEVPAIPRGSGVRIEVTTFDKQRTWTLRIGERELRIPIHLSGPAGAYGFRFESDGYVAMQKTVELKGVATLARVKLDPLPALTGRVVDRTTAAPVAGALVTAEAKSGRAISSANGRFTLTLNPEDWPKTLKISAGGYAERVMPAPSARSSAALDDIDLARGGTIVVQLHQPKPGDVRTLELYRVVNGGRTLGPQVRTLQVEKGSDGQALKFENLEPGDYLVLAKGYESWEKAGEPVVVAAAEESRLPLSIVPFRLRIQARSLGEAVPKAHVALRNRDMFWNSDVATDETGTATVTLWQGGRFNATVETAGGTPYLQRRVIEHSEDTEWVIDLPALEVTGTVVDASTGQPVPKAGIALRMVSPEGYLLSVQTEANAEGVFRFAPVTYGEHVLKAAARGYPVKELRYTFQEPEARHNVTVRLDPATPIHVVVTDARSNPISGARLIQYEGLTRKTMGTTDNGGTVEIFIPPGEVRDVFVVPRDGSLAFVRFAAPGKDTTVVVPDGVSRIVLRAVTEDGKPIPNVAAVMRYNGILIPYEVVAALTSRQGTQPASNAQGQLVLDHMPAGIYEFWPVGSPAELRELASGVGPSAPVRIAATPGENVAEMTFEPVAK